MFRFLLALLLMFNNVFAVNIKNTLKRPIKVDLSSEDRGSTKKLRTAAPNKILDACPVAANSTHEFTLEKEQNDRLLMLRVYSDSQNSLLLQEFLVDDDFLFNNNNGDEIILRQSHGKVACRHVRADEISLFDITARWVVNYFSDNYEFKDIAKIIYNLPDPVGYKLLCLMSISIRFSKDSVNEVIEHLKMIRQEKDNS